jgi:hypothetical protein
MIVAMNQHVAIGQTEFLLAAVISTKYFQKNLENRNKE